MESSCDEWWILSAKHGLVHPDEVLEPYDVALKDVGRPARREWSSRVLTAIEQRVPSVAGAVFEIHAGAEYWDFGLQVGLEKRQCEVPTKGMGIGGQLRFYALAKRRPL